MNTRSAARQANAQADTRGTEPALKYVQANGVRFAYLEQGDGPLVMLLHGFPDSSHETAPRVPGRRGASPSRQAAACIPVELAYLAARSNGAIARRAA